MPNELPLFDRYAKPEHVGAPYAIGSDTSKAAAKVVAKRIPQQQTDVYLCISMARDYGRTFDECVQLLGISPTASGRITALRDTGMIEDSGRTRKTRRGCAATVWIVKLAVVTNGNV